MILDWPVSRSAAMTAAMITGTRRCIKPPSVRYAAGPALSTASGTEIPLDSRLIQQDHAGDGDCLVIFLRRTEPPGTPPG
jgi:hypothetical protein